MTEIKVNTKPDELCIQLLAVAYRLGPGAKLPTGREMSRTYGVSRTTLQVALDRLESQNVVRRKQGSGVFVSDHLPLSPSERKIALICDFNVLRSPGHSVFWNMLVELAQQRALLKNEECQLHLTSPLSCGESSLLESLKREIQSGEVHGVIGVKLAPASIEWLLKQNLPLVSYAGWSPYTVRFDDKAIVELGVWSLIEQRCEKLAVWSATDSQCLSPKKEEATLPVDQNANLSSDSTMVRGAEMTSPAIGESHQEQGYRTALEIFSAPRQTWPDGVVITDDMMTSGVLLALQKLGLRAGEDVKIASQINRGSPVLMGHEEKLTLIEVDPAQLVQELFNQLETLMDGKTPEVPHVIIPPQVRKSYGQA